MLSETGLGAIGMMKTLSQANAQPAVVRSLAQAGIKADPLSDLPFVSMALHAFAPANSLGNARAAALLQEANRRNPRSRPAKVMLLRYAIGRNDLEGAFRQIAALERLNSPLAEQMIDVLAGAIGTQAQLAELTRYLRQFDRLVPRFTAAFIGNKPDRALLAQYARSMAGSLQRDPPLQLQLANALVRTGAVRAAWRLSGQGDASPNASFNPDFSNTRMPPPFNWLLAEDEVGIAERTPAGLYVRYYGRQSGALLSQVLALAPGVYVGQLDFTPRADLRNSMAIRLRCITSGEVLETSVLEAEGGEPSTASFTATVPAAGDCEGQYLELVGLSVQNAGSSQLTAHRFELQAARRQ